MTVQELKDRKNAVESKIKELLLQFNDDTGTQILGASITPVPSQITQNVIVDYKVSIGIAI